MTKITWNDREVHNPLLRVIAAMAVAFGVIVVLPVAIVLSLPLHWLLLVFGRRGFMTRSCDGRIEYSIDAEGFRKR